MDSFSQCLPTDEDIAIFLKLRDRSLWPIDNDFSDFATLRSHWRAGRTAVHGANNFDWYQQFKESRQS